MFVNFDSMFEPYEVDIEVYIEDKVVNKQTIEAPQQMIIANFLQLMNQAKDDKRPLKIRMTRPEIIWNNFENKQKILTNEVSFSNNAMIAFEESRVNNSD
jgi:FKBP-type peptidyl-prolyl cis-trans isomerase (trigger factor)